MPRKLHTIWWMVLLRGLVEGLLVAPYVAGVLHLPEQLTLYVPAVILGGGLIELAMFVWLRGHPFRGILRLVALGSVALGLFLLWQHPETTLGMLVVLTGLWMAVQGFAALWLGLSIVNHPYIRAVAVLAGTGSALFGVVAMLWLPPHAGPFIVVLAAYGVGSLALHVVVALRMRADRRRVLAEERAAAAAAAAPPPSPA